MLCLATGSRKPSDYILLFLPPVTAFWSFRKLAQGTSHAGEENPVEEISLIWLLPKWRSFMKMAVVAEVSTAEDMCVKPQCHWTNLFIFVYIILCVLNQEWGCFGWIWYLLWLVTITVETLLKLQLKWQFNNHASILSGTRKKINVFLIKYLMHAIKWTTLIYFLSYLPGSCVPPSRFCTVNKWIH